ncbi:MAG: transglutaminase-like domain-containing protein [Polyangia bacterium]
MSSAGHHIALFAHLCCRPDDELDLGSAALCIAEPEYPDLDIARYLQALDTLAERVRPAVLGAAAGGGQAAGDPVQRGLAVVRELVERLGFRGNTEAYDDPRNSFLNEVLDRRLGIPITLSVVAMEVARRLGVPLYGVSFPGHFLLRTAEPRATGRPAEDDRGEDGADDDSARPGPPITAPWGSSLATSRSPLLIDPFLARPLSSLDLKVLLQRVLGERREARADELRVAGKPEILLRMLNNLRNIYLRSGDAARLHLCTERIRLLEAAVRARAERGPQASPSVPN